MDFLSAAQHILEREGRPLHYKEISRRALREGLIVPAGLTPDATMGSRLYVDTKKEESRFERAGRGQFVLKQKSRRNEIARRVEEINLSTRQALRQRLHSMPADRFETLISELLINIGFDESTVQVTPYGNDGGIDVRGALNAGDVTVINAAVQVKRWKSNIQSRVVRELRGSLTAHEQGIIITTSDFSTGARAEANMIGKTPISLVNGTELIELLLKHEIGVNRELHAVYTLDEEWLDEIDGGGSTHDSPVPQSSLVNQPQKEVSVNFPLLVRAVNNPTVLARLLSSSGLMEFNETRYSSPSSAGKIASGWKSCNGWVYWQYQDPESKVWQAINGLRDRNAD